MDTDAYLDYDADHFEENEWLAYVDIKSAMARHGVHEDKMHKERALIVEFERLFKLMP